MNLCEVLQVSAKLLSVMHSYDTVKADILFNEFV